MTSFKEFLEDYEKKDEESVEKFLKRLEEGEVSSVEIYPPKSRFIKLREPIATSLVGVSVWSTVPFYGSTITLLVPRGDKKKFDDYCNTAKLGFTSRNLDEMIDLVKNTGRIQFALTSPPTFYKNLEFLEPLFRELEPPITPGTLSTLRTLGEREIKEYLIEFETLAGFGFDEYMRCYSAYTGMGEDYFIQRLSDYAFYYAALKFLGYDELVEEIGTLMITDYSKANKLLRIFINMIIIPSFNPLKAIFNFNKEQLTEVYELEKDYGIKPKAIPCEIGKFILEKLVRYPETLDGCWEIMQHYDDNELYKVLNALNEGVKERKIDIIEDKRDNITEILDNVWKETDKIKWEADIARLSVGLVGGLSANLSGIGILAGLGFSGIDKMVGLKMDSIGEKMAKVFSPNYLVTIFDFKKRHNMQK